MISRDQQILLKRAQAQAGLGDEEYREALETVSAVPGCRSSKDARLTDRHVDRLMGYFEAVYWRRVEAGEAARPSKANAVFREPGFWAGRNPAGNTSRDRYTEGQGLGAVAKLEAEMHGLGFGFKYLEVIKNRIRPFSLWAYRAALERTLASKRRQKVTENCPW
jgi:hypothetical protein